ncbi:618_t:CDS:2 [Paraglomus occultum]|uniref:Leucine carboxyl methyltransferase 1 n=1 Tax=Paraglomus occultum TaxID=144539 RepID=A0A9N8WDB5_9GLOM|nr:618_t:CDS:2 [Paraglomus occultum]
MDSEQEEAVRSTNDDAVISKASAVQADYISDNFVKYFVKRPPRRPPIINRGTYVRTTGLDTLITKFLETGNVKKQVVSLGAGSDTRYFSYKERSRPFHKYFEIDYPEITSRKVAIIRRHKQMYTLLGESARLGMSGMELYADDYCLIAECVLIYMEPEDSDKIVRWVGENMSAAVFVVYEQILPGDAFGSVMLQNLRMRNIELRGICAYPSLESQKERFLKRGWTHAEAIDINELHDSHIDPHELERISKLELLDEIEEWRLLSAHYCIAWAYVAKNESIREMFEQVTFVDYSPISSTRRIAT